MSLFPKPATRTPSPATRTPNPGSSDPRHVPVREEIWRVYNEVNNDLQCPWSGKHAKLLQRVLATATNWSVAQWHNCVLNRFASEGINPAEDPAEWLARLASYVRQPLNRFGKTDRVPPECWARQKDLAASYWAAQRAANSEVGIMKAGNAGSVKGKG